MGVWCGENTDQFRISNLGVCGESMDDFHVSKRIGKTIRKNHSAVRGADFLSRKQSRQKDVEVRDVTMIFSAKKIKEKIVSLNKGRLLNIEVISHSLAG